MEEIPKLIGFVSKETDGHLWARGAVWETKNEPKYFCKKCSMKTLEEWGKRTQESIRTLSKEEYEELYGRNPCDIIKPIQIPEKFKDMFFVRGEDWTYKLVPNGLLKCEKCGELVI